jgi:hypothetical protein
MVLRSARYAKWPAIVAAGYLVIAHPSLISDLFSGIASVLDLPELAVQFAGWFLLLIPVLYLGSWLLRLLPPLMNGLLWVVQIIRARGPGSPTRRLP